MESVRLKSRKLQQDAQSFIESVQKFQKEEEEEEEEEKKEEEKSPLQISFGFQTETPSEGSVFPRKILEKNKELLAFTEWYYNQFQKLPNLKDFQFYVPTELLPKDDEGWRDAMDYMHERLLFRGIQPYEVPPSYLEPNFLAAVGLVVTVADKRSLPAKLKQAGLTPMQWKTFLKIPRYKEYYQKQLDEIFNEDAQTSAKLALLHLIENRDLGAIKHLHEMQNVYRPQQNNGQILLILQVIMEILSQHVSGDILNRVAAALQDNPQLRAIETKEGR